MKKVNHISSFLACIGLILIIITPLCGLPVAVPGIPVWYQDTFFLSLIAGGGRLSQPFVILYRVFAECSLESGRWTRSDLVFL